MDSIKYKGKSYPLRHFLVKFDGDNKKDKPHFISVSVESLSEEMQKDCGESFENMTPEAEYVDGKVYFYVPDEVINLTSKEVCSCVDEVTFISEQV